MRLSRFLEAVLCVGTIACAPAFAQFTTISQPTSEYLTNTTLIAIPGSTPALISSPISGGGQTLTFSTNLTAYSAGIGAGLFNPWGTAPDVEAVSLKVLASGINQTALTITLSSPSATFGFELAAINRCEPLPACGVVVPPPTSEYPVTATFFNNATTLGTVTRNVTFNSARLFAASNSTPITRVQISAPLAAGGFAVAQLRFGNTLIGPPAVTAIPALGLPELGGLGLLLAAAGALLARRATLEA